VVRTFIYPSQSADLMRRLANYFSFVSSSLLLGGVQIHDSDYLLTESPPLFLGITGYLLSRWKRARWIFNVSDLWPESAVRIGMVRPGLALCVSEWLEAFCYTHARLVTGQSQSILASIQARFPNARTYLFSNGVDVKRFRSEMASDEALSLLHTNGNCVALYAGLHGLAQGLDQVIDAAAKTQQDQNLQIFLLGDGPTKAHLIQDAQARRLTNIHFLDPIAPEEMPGWIAAADIALVTLKTYIPGAVPSKLYEAMGAGKPVILVASGEPAEIVNKYRAGIAVEPGRCRFAPSLGMRVREGLESLANSAEIPRGGPTGDHRRSIYDDPGADGRVARRHVAAGRPLRDRMPRVPGAGRRELPDRRREHREAGLAPASSGRSVRASSRGSRTRATRSTTGFSKGST